jgi:hypothetical protein
MRLFREWEGVALIQRFPRANDTLRLVRISASRIRHDCGVADTAQASIRTARAGFLPRTLGCARRIVQHLAPHRSPATRQRRGATGMTVGISRWHRDAPRRRRPRARGPQLSPNARMFAWCRWRASRRHVFGSEGVHGRPSVFPVSFLLVRFFQSRSPLVANRARRLENGESPRFKPRARHTTALSAIARMYDASKVTRSSEPAAPRAL